MNAKPEAFSTPEKDWDEDRKEFKGEEARNVMRNLVGRHTPQDGFGPLIPFYFCPTWRSITLSRSITGEPAYNIYLSAYRLSLTRHTTLLLSFREAEIQRLEISIGKGYENRGDIDIQVLLDSGVIRLKRGHHYSPYLVVNLICAVFPFVMDERVEISM